MPDLLGATNPVPGYDNNTINRNPPASPANTQVSNITDPSRVSRSDQRSDQADHGNQKNFSSIQYDSNFQTFLQRLKSTPALSETLTKIFTGQERTVVLSGLSDDSAAEFSVLAQAVQMDETQLLSFLTSQIKAGTQFGGALFSVLRSAYARTDAESVRLDILQFLKTYLDYFSTGHIARSMQRNLSDMIDSLPASWSERLEKIFAQLESSIEAGDRAGSIALLKRNVFPLMSAYIGQTHDLGTARRVLGQLALNMVRYENGTEENLIQTFRRLTSYGPLKEMLGKIDDQALLEMLKKSQADEGSSACLFAKQLSSAASSALSGASAPEVQRAFSQLLSAILINESVYMPINHLVFPLEMDNKAAFAEMWVDPDAPQDSHGNRAAGGRTANILIKISVEGTGLFDISLTSCDRKVDICVSCPEKVVPFSKDITEALSEILKRNELIPATVSVKRMNRPLAITDVFPQIFAGKDSINVKI